MAGEREREREFPVVESSIPCLWYVCVRERQKERKRDSAQE
jgi:hypothetical protein